MVKPKFYVVWQGRKPGIYSDWTSCKTQVEKFEGARYKAFPTRAMAEAAWKADPALFFQKGIRATGIPPAIDSLVGEPIPDSICVDAACSGNPGIMEYRGVDTKSGAELFRMGPFQEATVNLGEFLGIVHALAYLKQRGSGWPVYSDSRTAIVWVRNKNVKTTLIPSEKNKNLFKLIERAVAWLNENTWPNRILKWETRHWGEIPADFGRK